MLASRRSRARLLPAPTLRHHTPLSDCRPRARKPRFTIHKPRSMKSQNRCALTTGPVFARPGGVSPRRIPSRFLACNLPHDGSDFQPANRRAPRPGLRTQCATAWRGGRARRNVNGSACQATTSGVHRSALLKRVNRLTGGQSHRPRSRAADPLGRPRPHWVLPRPETGRRYRLIPSRERK